MFSLLGGCYEWMFRKEELHLLIIGLDGSGKSLSLEALKARLGGSPPPDPARMVRKQAWGRRGRCLRCYASAGAKTINLQLLTALLFRAS